MNQHIHCIVDNCHYWKQGNLCDANEIVITSDRFGAEQPDRVDATMAGRLTPTQAGNCMETCCKTFVPQGSDKIGVDRVTRL
ncbi:MAG: DUF1540 domain-containing protein [Patescibacteria group bacterium]